MIKILLVEDNQGDVFLIEHALQEHHLLYELYVAKDGAEAIQYVSKMGTPGNAPCPDLMLLDLNLPKIDGSDVLREFRKHRLCLLTPVIVVTSSDAQKDRDRMADLGVAHYFRKPSDFDEFMKLGEIVRQIAGDEAV
jgi:chemotaxis family two-component system response regulator Rcp1